MPTFKAPHPAPSPPNRYNSRRSPKGLPGSDPLMGRPLPSPLTIFPWQVPATQDSAAGESSAAQHPPSCTLVILCLCVCPYCSDLLEDENACLLPSHSPPSPRRSVHELRNEGTVYSLHHTALRNFSQHFCMHLGLGLCPKLSSKCATHILISPPGKGRREDGVAGLWKMQDPGAQILGLHPSLHLIQATGRPPAKMGGYQPGKALPPPFSTHAFRKGGRGPGR